jgi:hypothetical protein
MKKYLTQDQSETTMTKRFDLEQSIMNCWQITDDLAMLLPLVEDNDTASNILIGLKDLYQLKFEKCFNLFEEFLHEIR